MLYLTCTMISSVDLAHYGVSHAKDWVSLDCGTMSVGLSQKSTRTMSTQIDESLLFKIFKIA